MLVELFGAISGVVGVNVAVPIGSADDARANADISFPSFAIADVEVNVLVGRLKVAVGNPKMTGAIYAKVAVGSFL